MEAFQGQLSAAKASLSDYYNVPTAPLQQIGGLIAKAPQQDSVGSLISQLYELSAGLNGAIGYVADTLEGCSAKVSQANSATQPAPSSIIDQLRGILYVLQSANGESNRAKRALGIQ